MRGCSVLFVVLFACAVAAGQSTTFSYSQVPDGPPPCVSGNRANGINPRGDIAGRCQDASGNPRSLFMAKDSAEPVLLDFSAAPFNPVGGSTTRSVNARGDIVGRWFDTHGISHGYFLSGGVFTAVDVTLSGAVDTDVRGINNAGMIVGLYDVMTTIPNLGTIPVPHGFIRDAGGTFTAINYPGAAATTAHGINDAGDIVGSYVVITNATTKPPTVAVHGYILSHGVFTAIDVPFTGATATLAFGINEEGEIAGSYTTDQVTVATLLKEAVVNTHGYMRSADGTTFVPIDFPNAISTACRGGINPRDNIVGAYVDSVGAEHGFVTSR